MRLRNLKTTISSGTIPRTSQSLGQIFSSSVELMRRHPSSLIGSTFSGSLILFCALFLLFGSIIPGLFTTNNPNSILQQSLELTLQVALACFVALPAMMIGIALISWPVCQTAIKDLYVSDKKRVRSNVPPIRVASFSEVLQLCIVVAIRAILPFLVCIILLVVAAFLGDSGNENTAAFMGAGFIILLMVSVFWVLIDLPNFIFALPVIMVEKLSIKQAFKRSRLLLKFGGFPRAGGADGLARIALFLILMIVLLNYLFSLGLEFLHIDSWLTHISLASASGSIIAKAVQNIPILLGIVLAAPLYLVNLFIYYIDRRIRLEAFDIELLVVQNAN